MNCPHCNTHIDEHPASRCLDAWVAETVMEFRYITLSPDDEQHPLVPPAYGYSEEVDELRKEDYRRWWRWQGRDSAELVPAYSTSIAAAWEVVEKLSADGYGCNILKHSDPRGDCLCEFWHTKAIDLGRWCSNHQPTVALAICRAAIKASD